MKYFNVNDFGFIYYNFVYIYCCKIYFEKNINLFLFVIFFDMRYNLFDDKWVFLFQLIDYLYIIYVVVMIDLIVVLFLCVENI